jgi:hypothetical protein
VRFFGSTAIKASALVTAVLLLVSAGVALLAKAQSDRRELELHKELVSRYCNVIDNLQPTYRIVDWRESMTIGERGDTHTKLKVTLRSLQPELRFVRMKFGCGWPQPRRYRRRVRMTVRRLQVNGSPGTKLTETSSWLSEARMDAIIHFPAPRPQNSEVSFTVDLVWPRRCAPLSEFAPDEFTLKFKQPVEHASYQVILPKGVDCYLEPVDGCESLTGFQISKGEDGNGHKTVTVEVRDLLPRQRAGVRLELKK